MSEEREPRQKRSAEYDLYPLENAGLTFRPKDDYELDKLSDEGLIDYVVAARHAGDDAAAKRGLGIFAYRKFDLLADRARRKPHISDHDAEDIAGQVIEGAFKAAFRGEFYGEAMAFLTRVLANKINDHYRKLNFNDALPEDRDDDEYHGPDVAISPDETSLVDLEDVIDGCFRKLSPEHRKVVDLFVFDGHDANSAAEKVNEAFPELQPPMSDQNVHKIASRFRKELRNELE